MIYLHLKDTVKIVCTFLSSVLDRAAPPLLTILDEDTSDIPECLDIDSCQKVDVDFDLLRNAAAEIEVIDGLVLRLDLQPEPVDEDTDVLNYEV